MKTVRTCIRRIYTPEFKEFLVVHNLASILVGDYNEISNSGYLEHYICYAYSENDSETVANLTYLMLKYGDIDTAFADNIIKK